MRRNLIDARNTADNTIYATKKMLNELGEKAPPTEKSQVENLITELKEAMDGDDINRIRSLTDLLQQMGKRLVRF